jgi:beta-glucosidase
MAVSTRALLLLLLAGGLFVSGFDDRVQAPAIGVRSAGVLTVNGLKFRDSNRNGTLDVYEDWRKPAAERARDLVSKMRLEEKAGLMMHGTAPGLGGPAGVSNRGYDLEAARALIVGRNVTSMISRLMLSPATLAAQNNALQAVAETGRLGIPLTLSTDPRHHFQYVEGASVRSTGLSQWPETLGFGALNDPALVRKFGDIARQEYRALGFQMALSPQADLATEPRWPRVTGTFGEDPDRVGALAQA